MKKLIEQLTAVSTTMADTIYSCLAWSGATRIVGNFGINETHDAEHAYLASLTTLITNKDIAPTVNSVISLLTTPPVLESPSTQSLEALKAAGEDTDGITQTLKEEHNLAMARFTKQVTHIVNNEQEIRAKIQAAFDADKVTFIKLPETLEAQLTAKLWTKVDNRRRRLIADISQGRFVEQNAAELGAINHLLTQKAA
jgi:hypothetical protein